MLHNIAMQERHLILDRFVGLLIEIQLAIHLVYPVFGLKPSVRVEPDLHVKFRHKSALIRGVL